MKQLIGILLSCVGLTFLMGWWLWSTFQIQQNKLCAESSLLFAEAIQKEKVIQIKIHKGNYTTNQNISGAEKAEWCSQAYLFYRDSTRTLLDSLFRAKLSEQKIQAKTAIRSTREGKIIETNPDSTFYRTALPLKQLVFRIDENPEKNITLQAYIKYPFGFVWKHSFMMWRILGLWLLLSGGIIGGYYLWNRRMLRIAKQQLQIQQQKLQQKQQQSKLQLQQKKLQQQEKELIQKELEQSRELTQKNTTSWIRLSDNLFFNEEYGDLRYNYDVHIILTDNSLKLFRYFIEAEQKRLTYELICKEVLIRFVENGVSKSDKEAVANAISRLRINLESIPAITIESLRSTGYQMIILSPDNIVQ